MKNIFIGIDFSKETFDATIICSSMMIAPVHEKFENKPGDFSKLRTWIRKNSYGTSEENWLLCGENTGVYCQNMCDWMFAKGIDIWIENALQIKRSMGLQRGKNDKIDSVNIAEYASRFVDKMRPYVPDTKEIKELRGIFMRRRTFSKMRKQLKNEHQEKIKKYYNRLLNRGKIRGVALNNVKAKLINIVFTMVRRGTMYDPNYDMIKTTNKQKGEILKNAC